MSKPIHETSLLSGFVPHQIEAEWNPRFAYLAGFPVNLLSVGVREIGGSPRPASCCYWFDPGTYSETSEGRRMWYFPRHESPYRVCVSVDRNGSGWQTVKYHEDRAVCIAEGPSFAQAMLQTMQIGLLPDEPADPEAPADAAAD